MTVVPLTRGSSETCPGWQQDELQALLGLYAAYRDDESASGWAVGATEAGEPQFYILGPKPEQDCVLCISRVGRTVVVEDGGGHCLLESSSFGAVIDGAR